ncbi:MAG: hypothetical protein IPL46_34275 [Saprospiraceae bacterium]|nr:hypothetical protein [Saprospiraceae bacterium]
MHSIPSNEDCAGIKLNKPFITQVSILNTDNTSGEISVQWTKPNGAEIDTIAFPGPYRFVLSKGDGFDPATLLPVPGADFTSNTFQGLVDTSFVDMNGLNTQDNVYSYQVSFYANNRVFSTSGDSFNCETKCHRQ